uniref:Saccharopine dehydrogenase NADP binding domain-containing protein n=1 Tax=Plectus sambesii TaxID=2011161 RepID=A0A914XHG3_9BILA
MSARPYDLVIYGATGFTGAFIVEVLAKQDEKNEVKWAVAGRNEKRLSSMLTNVSKKIGKNVRDVPVIIADTKNAQSLASMASQTKLIINAVGPYRLHGEAVVKAAVENGASHVDISGEPAWLEKMQMKYAELAKEKGVYVVGACGWDSIPCDLGVTFTERNFPGDLNHIETFMQLQTGKMVPLMTQSYKYMGPVGKDKANAEHSMTTVWADMGLRLLTAAVIQTHLP